MAAAVDNERALLVAAAALPALLWLGSALLATPTPDAALAPGRATPSSSGPAPTPPRLDAAREDWSPPSQLRIPAPVPRRRIRARLVDADGRLYRNAKVQLWRLDDRAAAIDTRSDEGAHIALDLVPGRYMVTVNGCLARPAETYDLLRVDLGTTPRMQTLETACHATAIRIHVVDSRGHAIPHAKLEFHLGRDPVAFSCDASGRAHLLLPKPITTTSLLSAALLAEPEYRARRVLVRVSGHAKRSFDVDELEARRVENQAREIVLVLERESVLEITCRDPAGRSIPGCTIVGWHGGGDARDGSEDERWTSDARGRVLARGIRAGDWLLRIARRDWPWAEPRSLANSELRLTVRAASRNSVVLRDHSPPSVRIEASWCGRPVEAGRAVLRPVDGSASAQARSFYEGGACFRQVAAGAYRLSIAPSKPGLEFHFDVHVQKAPAEQRFEFQLLGGTLELDVRGVESDEPLFLHGYGLGGSVLEGSGTIRVEALPPGRYEIWGAGKALLEFRIVGTELVRRRLALRRAGAAR